MNPGSYAHKNTAIIKAALTLITKKYNTKKCQYPIALPIKYHELNSTNVLANAS